MILCRYSGHLFRNLRYQFITFRYTCDGVTTVDIMQYCRRGYGSTNIQESLESMSIDQRYLVTCFDVVEC